MDRKIELEMLSDAAFQEMMATVNAEVLTIARNAQEKINELLIRFNVKCDLSLSYSIADCDPQATLLNELPTQATPIPEIPVKKKRGRKKKA